MAVSSWCTFSQLYSVSLFSIWIIRAHRLQNQLPSGTNKLTYSLRFFYFVFILCNGCINILSTHQSRHRRHAWTICARCVGRWHLPNHDNKVRLYLWLLAWQQEHYQIIDKHSFIGKHSFDYINATGIISRLLFNSVWCTQCTSPKDQCLALNEGHSVGVIFLSFS